MALSSSVPTKPAHYLPTINLTSIARYNGADCSAHTRHHRRHLHLHLCPSHFQTPTHTQALQAKLGEYLRISAKSNEFQSFIIIYASHIRAPEAAAATMTVCSSQLNRVSSSGTGQRRCRCWGPILPVVRRAVPTYRIGAAADFDSIVEMEVYVPSETINRRH